MDLVAQCVHSLSTTGTDGACRRVTDRTAAHFARHSIASVSVVLFAAPHAWRVSSWKTGDALGLPCDDYHGTCTDPLRHRCCAVSEPGRHRRHLGHSYSNCGSIGGFDASYVRTGSLFLVPSLKRVATRLLPGSPSGFSAGSPTERFQPAKHSMRSKSFSGHTRDQRINRILKVDEFASPSRICLDAPVALSHAGPCPELGLWFFENEGCAGVNCNPCCGDLCLVGGAVPSNLKAPMRV